MDFLICWENHHGCSRFVIRLKTLRWSPFSEKPCILPDLKTEKVVSLNHTFDASDIRHPPVEVGSLSHYLQGLRYIQKGGFSRHICLHHRQYVFNQPEINHQVSRKPRGTRITQLFQVKLWCLQASFHPSRLNTFSPQHPSITIKKKSQKLQPNPGGFSTFFTPPHFKPASTSPFPGPDGIIRSIWVDQGRGCDPELVVWSPRLYPWEPHQTSQPHWATAKKIAPKLDTLQFFVILVGLLILWYDFFVALWKNHYIIG